MSYFRLFPDCHYEKGISNGLIYNLSESETIHLNENESNIIDKLLGNKKIEELSNDSVCKSLIDRLIKQGCGAIYEQAVFAETYAPNNEWTVEGLIEQPPLLKTAYLQLSDKCNANCSFCNDRLSYKVQGCNSCIRWNRSTNKIEQEDFYSALEFLSNLQVMHVTFVGGNPLLEWEYLVGVADYLGSRNPNISFRVNTNGFGLNIEIAQKAKEMGISFLFTIFADSPEKYYEITGTQGLFESLTNAINICREFYIPYSVNLLLLESNKDYFLEMQAFVKQIGGMQLFATEIISKTNLLKKLTTLPTGRDRIERIDVGEFFSRKKFNTCVNGSIAISSDGVVTICPGWEEQLLQLPHDSLCSIFKDKSINKHWFYTKKEVPVCGDCEYKFLCSDCSVLENAAKNDVKSHKIYCSYNPNSGKWEDELK